MEYRTLGRTGLKISEISYGCAGFTTYSAVSEEESRRSVYKAIDEYGINYFDTSPSYGGINSERILGNCLEGRRHEVIIATKTLRYAAENWWGYDYTEDPKRIRLELENQLRRLKTDYVDILQIHDVDNADMERVIHESLPEMEKLRQEGKIRYIGITSRVLGSVRYVLERSDSIDSILTFARYNLMDTSAERYLDAFVKERNLGILNCSVIYMRALTKAAAEGRLQKEWPMAGFSKEQMAVLKEASDLCEANGVDFGELAFQFGTDSDYFHSHVISMAHMRRLDQNMRLYGKPYRRDLAERVYELLSPMQYLPDNEDIHRGRETLLQNIKALEG